MIPYSTQTISETDIQAVVDVMRSQYLTQGGWVMKFEQKIKSKVGVPYAIAVNSATSALHLACLSLDVGNGDLVWTSPNSFVASSNCALHCGAQIDFVDIDKKTYNICPVKLAKKLDSAEKLGNLPKVLIVVHFSGQSCDMDAITSLSSKYGFKLIEDASHAMGAKWNDKVVGSCHYSDITVFSFHPVKMITTGEGGMLTTRNASIA